MKIGVLIPQSNAYPLMGKEFINGLKLSLEEMPVQLIIESIGFGSDPSEVINTVQKLYLQEEVALTTGLFGHYGFSDLANFVSKNEEILLAANLGANQPIETPIGVYQNSLGLYNSLGSLTNYFSEINVKNIATSSCYYESGYDFFDALDKGMNEQVDMQFSGHFITPLHPQDNEANLMEGVMTATSPDAIVAFHNGQFAKEHATYLEQNELQKKYPIYCLPFSCEDHIIEEFSSTFKDIRVVSTWFPELNNIKNHEFVTAYQAKHNKAPSFFALLGYENGLIIKAALEDPTGSLNEKMHNILIEGPRGALNFTPSNRNTQFDNYIWDIDENIPSKKQVVKLKPYLSKLIVNEKNNGWYNAYLCH